MDQNSIQNDEEKFITDWANDPICSDKKRPIKKALLYKAFHDGRLVGYEIKGCRGIRVSKKEMERFLSGETNG